MFIPEFLDEFGLLEPTTRVIYVFGRPLFVPWTSGDVCKFTFAQICEEVQIRLSPGTTAAD